MIRRRVKTRRKVEKGDKEESNEEAEGGRG